MDIGNIPQGLKPLSFVPADRGQRREDFGLWTGRARSPSGPPHSAASARRPYHGCDKRGRSRHYQATVLYFQGMVELQPGKLFPADGAKYKRIEPLNVAGSFGSMSG